MDMAADIILVDGFHTSKAVRQMDKLRKKSMLCDIVLKVNDTKIPAHKIVLASSSPYFEFMFTGKLSEDDKEEVELKGLCPNMVSALVNYIYSGELTVKEDSILTALETADYLKICGAKEKCLEYLQKNIKVQNCLRIKNVASKCSFTELGQRVNKFIQLHAEEISKSKEFLNLSADDVESLLIDKDIKIGYESSLKSLEAWVDFAPLARRISKSKISNSITGHFKALEEQEQSEYYDIRTKKRVYIFDCKDSNKCHQFDLENLSLHDIRDRQNLRDFIPVCHQESIYLVSGSDNSKYKDDCPRYDTATNVWSHASIPTTQVFKPGACVLGDRIYIIGGQNSKNVSSYDLRTNSLTLEPQLMHIREMPGVTTHGSCIYACGGTNERSVERLDTRMKKWSSISNISKDPLGHCTAVSFLDNIYCIPMSSSSSFFSYDIRKGAWDQRANMPSEGNSSGFHNTLVSTDEAIYAVNVNGIYTYVPKINEWTRLLTYKWSYPLSVAVLPHVNSF